MVQMSWHPHLFSALSEASPLTLVQRGETHTRSGLEKGLLNNHFHDHTVVNFLAGIDALV